MKLPEDKRNKIEEKNDNPTRYVMNNWIARDGKKATVKKFLEALNECEQAGLAHKIEQMLGVELKDENDLTDGIANVHLRQENKRKHWFEPNSNLLIYKTSDCYIFISRDKYNQGDQGHSTRFKTSIYQSSKSCGERRIGKHSDCNEGRKILRPR